jgi:hypothetical protein
LTDGLPIIPPTEDKVKAMLDYAGLQPSDIIAREGIREKDFVAEKVAINAVMAGCRPEHMPVIVAAVEGMCEQSYNLQANTTTTNGAGVLALISGPIANELGINSGTVLMGHGFRANATIGRALALMKINIYGSVPHHMDKSTFGHPGKYTFCFAENDDVLPWEPHRVEKGFSAESSTVTVFAAVSPLQVNTHGYNDPEQLLSTASDAVIVLGPRHEEMMIVIAPELLEYFRRNGWTKPQIKEFVFEKSQRTGREWNYFARLEKLVTGDDLERRIPAIKSAEHITVVGAGGAAGPFISVIGSWGGSTSITKEIKRG